MLYNEHVISHEQRINPSITIQKTILLHSQTQKNCRVRCRDIPIHTVSFILARFISSASVPDLQGSDSFLQSNSAVSPKLHRVRSAHYMGHWKNTQSQLLPRTVTDLISLLRTWCSGDRGQSQLTLKSELISCATLKLMVCLDLFLPFSFMLFILGTQWSRISGF